MHSKYFKLKTMAFSVSIVSVMVLTACEKKPPTYNSNAIAENQQMAALVAKAATENALKARPLPKFEPSKNNGVVALAPAVTVIKAAS